MSITLYSTLSKIKNEQNENKENCMLLGDAGIFEIHFYTENQIRKKKIQEENSMCMVSARPKYYSSSLSRRRSK